MKKRFSVFVSVFMSLIFAVVVVVAATGSPKKDPAEKIVQPEGVLDMSSGREGDTLAFTFTRQASVNTVELKETTGVITRFEIGTFEGETVYVSDYIGEYRYCSFPAVTTKGLYLKITEAEDAFEIASMEVSFVTQTASDDFKVMAYVTADSACKMDDSWKENAKTVTQFNIIGCLFFDINGRILFDGYDEAGLTDGEEVFERALANLKKLNPEAEIVATILGNRDLTGDGITESEDRYNKVIGNDGSRSAFINEIVEFAYGYDLDGVSFDYEYPHSLSSFVNYNAFLQELKQALGDKRLTAALSLWNIGLFNVNSDTLRVLDGVELMSYDSFDERGNHSTFLTAYNYVTQAIQRGADPKVLNLGLPYYSRPVNKDAYWGSYKHVADKLGYGDNLITETYVIDGETRTQPNYYNGRQTIYDKTCYALDSGIGGVMIWHFACDSTDPDLSLTAAVQRAIDSRS